MLTLPAEWGEKISTPPLALNTIADRAPGIELFQIVQTAPAELRLRMRLAPNVDPNQVWQTMHAEIQQMLGEHGVGNVELKRADEEPQQSRAGSTAR